MKSNFEFLSQYWEELAKIGENAETYLYSDPNASIFKIRVLSERIVQYIFYYENITIPSDNSQYNMINVLKRMGLIPDIIDSILYSIRKIGNEAVHKNNNSLNSAKTILRLGFNLSCWFMELYGDWKFERPTYIEPEVEADSNDNIRDILKLQEKRIEELSQSLHLIVTQSSNIEVGEKGKQSVEIANNLDISAQELNLIQQENVRIEVDASTAISYALQQNGYDAINTIYLENRYSDPLENVVLSISSNSEAFEDYSKDIAILPAGERVVIQPVRIKINIDYLIGLTEKQKATFVIQLRSKDTILLEELVDINVLAYDQWSGTSFYPETVCSFIMPNHPAISSIISKAADYMYEWTRISAFDGYQSGDKNRVNEQAAAIYSAIQSLQITYAEIPSNFDYIGQRIRLCDAVLNHKLGNCLDIALLYASCLEAVGIHPILCIKPGHIFVGIWLIDSNFSDAVSDDVTLLNKRIAEGINEIKVIESTYLTSSLLYSFDSASEKASTEILDQNPVEMIIDVQCARLMGIAPMLSRILTDAGYIASRPEREINLERPEGILDYKYKDNSESTFDKRIQWERKLLDLGLRNNLINLHLSRSIVPILTPSLDELEDTLDDGESFVIYPKPDGWKNSDIKDDFTSISNLGEFIDFIQNEFKVFKLHSSLTETELSSTLKTLYRNARTSFDENGANTLFIALGLLKWCEPRKVSSPHYAPLILLPVEIIKKSASSGYTIALRRDDEPQVNITILEKLKQEYDLVINGLDVLPEDEHGIDVRRILTIFRNAVLEQPYWDVLESAYLGIFSFSQFVMWNDIHNRLDDLEKNKIVKSLIEGHLVWEPHTISKSEGLQAEDSYLPLPVDESQLYAIKEAESDESFVLHGPPGTGKSQTITSMIADLLAKNKKVLFVAEKRAALDVVQKRIEDLGLGVFCLELHSNKAKKQDVFDKIKKVMDVAENVPSNYYYSRLRQMKSLRADLDVYARELHQIRECGSSLYEILNKYEYYRSFPGEIPVSFNKISEFTEVVLDDQTFLIDELIISAKSIGHPKTHPLHDIHITEYHEGIEQELLEKIDNYLLTQKQYQTLIDELSAAFHMDSLADRNSYVKNAKSLETLLRLKEFPLEYLSLRDISKIIELLPQLQRKKEDLYSVKSLILERWDNSFLSKDAKSLLDEYSGILSSNLLSKAIQLNKFSKGLSAYSLGGVDKNSLKLDLQNLQRYQNALSNYEEFIESNGEILKQINSNTEINADLIDMLQRVEATKQEIIDHFGSEDIIEVFVNNKEARNRLDSLEETVSQYEIARNDLDSVLKFDQINGNDWAAQEQTNLSRIKENIHLLKEWVSWNKKCKTIDEQNLHAVVDAYYSGIDHDQIKGTYIKSFYKKLVNLIIESEPSLEEFNGELFDRKVEQFRKYDAQLQNLAKEFIYNTIALRISKYVAGHRRDPKLSLINKLVKSKGRGITIRKLFESNSDVLLELFPCLLMSPISTAQYLDPNAKKFDYVIFDEASQLQTCKAVGPIARGHNAVIVGDPKQMPPTNFFMANNIDEDNIIQEDLDSILDDALAINMPESYLNWHYRSTHESLIAFSNNQFYDNQLYTFPSINDKVSRVKLVKVDGVFERGRKRVNEKEAEEIITEIKRRYNDPVLKKDSIGVVTFNVYQQNLIEDMLNEACAKNKGFETWVSKSEEPLFIKNLESVQGDERDIILFSVTYGPDETGKVSMNFGPLNRDGGERRLNVAVSRARKEMVVFSSLIPEQINTARTKSIGVKALKNFLSFASSNVLAINSDFNKKGAEKEYIIQSISDELKKQGYKCDTMIGHSRFKVDLGVINPENEDEYIFGVLIDGDSYAQSSLTRDREVSQQGILKNLGWQTIRIWSLDWWNNKEQQLSAIKKELDLAISKYRGNHQKENIDLQKSIAEIPSDDTEIIDIKDSEVQRGNDYAIDEIKATEKPQEKEQQDAFKEETRPLAETERVYKVSVNGSVKESYENVFDASKSSGKSISAIMNSIKYNITDYDGSYWVYARDYKKPINGIASSDSDKSSSGKGKPVYMLNAQGMVVHKFDQLSYAANYLQVSNSKMYSLIIKTESDSSGYYWAYADGFNREEFLARIGDHNTVDKIRNKKAVYRLTSKGIIVTKYDNLKAASKAVNRSTSYLYARIINKDKDDYGFYWAYVEDYEKVNRDNNESGSESTLTKISREKKPVYMMDRYGEVIAKYEDITEAANDLGIAVSILLAKIEKNVKDEQGNYWTFNASSNIMETEINSAESEQNEADPFEQRVYRVANTIIKKEAPVVNNRLVSLIFNFMDIKTTAERRRIIEYISTEKRFNYTIELDQVLYWINNGDENNYKQYRTKKDLIREIDEIPYIEIINCMKETLSNASIYTRDKLFKQVASKMGYEANDGFNDLCDSAVLYQPSINDELLLSKRKKEDTSNIEKDKQKTFFDELDDNSFEYIDDRGRGGSVWVIYDSERRKIFENIALKYDISFVRDFRRSTITNGRKAWRVDKYTG